AAAGGLVPSRKITSERWNTFSLSFAVSCRCVSPNALAQVIRHRNNSKAMAHGLNEFVRFDTYVIDADYKIGFLSHSDQRHRLHVAGRYQPGGCLPDIAEVSFSIILEELTEARVGHPHPYANGALISAHDKIFTSIAVDIGNGKGVYR